MGAAVGLLAGCVARVAEAMLPPGALSPTRLCIVRGAGQKGANMRGRRAAALGAALLGTMAAGATPGLALPGSAPVLRVVDVERDDGSGRLDGPVPIAVSPDGANVYVGAAFESAITVFARDPLTGALSVVQVVRDDGIVPIHLGGPFSLVVSPDGAHVYVGAFLGDAVVVFARHPTTGALTWVETVEDGVSVPPFLSGVQGLAISDDGLRLYAMAGGEDTISVFDRAPATGLLTLTQTVLPSDPGISDLASPLGLALHPFRPDAYVAAGGSGALLHFHRDPSGTLHVPPGAPLVVSSGLDNPQLVSVASDGNHVYLSDSGRDAIFAWSYGWDDSGALDLEQIATDGYDDFEGLAGATGLALHPEGTLLYATGLDDDAVAVLARDETSGRLRPLDVCWNGEEGSALDGAAFVTASPDGRHLYATAPLSDAVVAFAVPHLRFLGSEVDGVGGADALAGARAVAIAPDGRHAYVAAPDEDAIGVFARDPRTGATTFVEAVRDGVGGVDGLDGVFALTTSADGRHLYVRAAGDGSLAVFARNAADGRLGFVGVARDGVDGADGLAGPGMVVVSPDGAQVYASSVTDSAVAVFARNPATGGLTFLDAVMDGDPGVTDLDHAAALTFDGSGAHLYVTGSPGVGQGSLTVFTRNAGTGALTAVQVLRQGSGGVEGLASPVGALVSPDGRHVYVASGGLDPGIGVFDRDSGDGTLLFVERARFEPDSGIVGGDTASGIASSPDGTRLYASAVPSVMFGSGPAGAVHLFLRDPLSGRLARASRSGDGEGEFTDMTLPRALAATPDGRHVLVPASGADALAVLAVPEPAPGLAAAAACVGLALAAAGGHRSRRGQRPAGVRRPRRAGLLPGWEERDAPWHLRSRHRRPHGPRGPELGRDDRPGPDRSAGEFG